MIVADASAVVDLLLGQRGAATTAAALESESEIHVPEHFHVEAISALRRLRLHGALGEVDAARAVSELATLRAVRYPVLALAAEIWSLRTELTAYDAAYLALAIRLNAVVVTADRGLASAAHKRGRLLR